VHLAETRNPDTDPDEWFRRAAYKTKNLTALLRRKNFAALDAVETVTVITGRAAFLDPHTVTVATRHDTLTMSAGVIVIDTGSEPVIPDIPGLSACCHAYTSTGLLDTTQRPRRLAVIGGGNVGLEFASVYAQFGCDVTVLEESGRLFAHEDDDVATAAISLLLDAGVNIRTGAHVTGIDDHAETAVVSYTHDGAEAAVEAEAVLIAVGRVPATLGLGLHDAGVHTTERGAVLVDDHLRSSRPHIYAVGDVNGGPQFTYISHDDSRIVLDQLVGTGARSTRDRVAVINLVAMAMRQHVTASELRDTIFTHPTSTEAIGEVLSARRPARAKPSMPAVTGVPS
jgi:probable pyridine nucleotide-disulfide oxidoreductase